MKRESLTKCIGCDRGVFHSGGLIFFNLLVSRLVANVGAIERQHALETLTGSPAIAQAIGPHEDLASEIGLSTFNVCQECAVHVCLAELIERANRSQEHDL